MAAGFKYNLDPPEEKEERYDVQTGIRRRGIFVLDGANLTLGTHLPVMTPIYADLSTRKAYVVRNMKVYAEASTTDTTIEIAKGSLAYVGMFIGNGSKGAKVTAIDKTNENYDVLTVDATMGVKLTVGTILFEATAAEGQNQKYVANSALFHRRLIEEGIIDVALLRTAAEIEPDKLVIPFSANDKEALKGWFQFNE